MKSYRSRTLNRQCQIAKSDPHGSPVRDAEGNPVLDHGGLWFFHISGGDHHDRKRVVPVDPQAFFKHKADEINEALKKRGKDRTVTPEEVYAEYVKAFRRPGETYAPPDHPEEFSMVLSKELCCNWTHGYGTAAAHLPTSIPPEQTSIFLRLMTEDAPAKPADDGGKRKGKTKGLSLEELGIA